MADVLAKLFGTPTRVKIMRLFLFNPLTPLTRADVAQKSRSGGSARKEIALLESIGLIRKISFIPTRSSVRKDSRKKRSRAAGWQLNERFPFLAPLKIILIGGNPLNKREEIVRRFRGCGTIKLIAIAGAFLGENESRVDVLLVGDNLNKRRIETALRGLEADMGKDLTYASFETPEFKYRSGVRDRFVRDVFDYPHEKILDKLG